MQVADRIERVTENFVNFYLVEEAGRVTVVDVGMPGNWDLLVGGLARIGSTLGTSRPSSSPTPCRPRRHRRANPG